MKKALGSLTALLLLIVMLPAAAEAAEGRIKYWYASRYTDEGYVWVEQSETWTDTGVTDNGETGRILDTPPDGAELWITNPPVPLTVEGNFSDVYLIGGTVTFLGDIEWLTLFEADWESPDITVYGDIEKITMSPLRQGEMSLRTTGDIFGIWRGRPVQILFLVWRRHHHGHADGQGQHPAAAVGRH